MTQLAAAGWYQDPVGTYEYRYRDGSRWTNEVSTGGTTGSDPNALDPAVATTPPAPGSAAPDFQSAPAPEQVQITQKSGGSFFGTLVAVILGVVAVIAIIVVLMNVSSDGDDADSGTDPVTTEAPSDDSSDS